MCCAVACLRDAFHGIHTHKHSAPDITTPCLAAIGKPSLSGAEMVNRSMALPARLVARQVRCTTMHGAGSYAAMARAGHICVCTYMHVCVCACHMQGDLTLPVWAPLPALDVHTLHTYLCICYSCPPKHICIHSTRQRALLRSRGIAHGVGCVQRTLQSICRWCCRSEYV